MEKDKIIEHKIAETYAGDMAEVIENDKGGLIKKIIHGEKEHQEEKKNLSPKSKKNKLFMLVSILLIIIALVTLYFLFFKKNINTVSVEKQFTSIIFNDQSAFLEVSILNKQEIVQTILSEINTTKVKDGGIEGIYLTENKKIIGLRRFISLIKSNFIPGDNLLFVNDNFLLGTVNVGVGSSETAHPGFFVLLKVRETADIFGALRAWEGKMLSDLSGFIGVDISSDTNYLFTKDFQDGIMNNKNARVLYDKNGNIVMMYVFADDNSVIITGSQNAAQEIMLRLTTAQKKQ